MGGTCSRRKPMRFLIQGLDAAGKTSLLYRLKLGEVVTTIPTIGFNVESLEHKGMEIMGWDLGGRDKVRPLYRHYYPGTDGLIYIIDSADVERLDDALEELDSFIFQNEELANRVVMVLANKQDLAKALRPDEIEARMMAKSKIWFGKTVFVMPCSVTTGEGMWEAFSYFVDLVKEKKTEGKVPEGLIPKTWRLGANQKQKKKEIDDVTASPGMMHRIKNSWLKDPYALLKSFLFY